MVAEWEMPVLKTLVKDELDVEMETSANHTSVLYFYHSLISMGPQTVCKASCAAMCGTLGSWLLVKAARVVVPLIF